MLPVARLMAVEAIVQLSSLYWSAYSFCCLRLFSQNVDVPLTIEFRSFPYPLSLIPAPQSLRQLPQQILIELDPRFKIRDREVLIGRMSLTVGQGESE